jgi:putative ABC transport system ATP-binding protein
LPQPFITLHDVYFSYPDGKEVLKGVNLDVKEHDLIIIKGESGAGKSTLLKLFNRFCDASKGDVAFHNKELTQYEIDQIRSSIIYVPQQPFMISGTVQMNFSFPFSFTSHKHKHFNPDKAKEWLEYFQLNIPLNHDASRLSTGQKQRIALIRSMLLEPEVLLLDEPGSALDAANKRLIEEKIEHLINTSKVTVLMATHSEVSFKDRHYRAFRLEDNRLRHEL